jgi:hypothetical protein
MRFGPDVTKSGSAVNRRVVDSSPTAGAAYRGDRRTRHGDGASNGTVEEEVEARWRALLAAEPELHDDCTEATS